VSDAPDAMFARLRQGDVAAFDALYERHREPVFRFLVRLCGRRELAEDLFQETWLRFARHARTLREDTNVPAWLFTVARNLFRSHLRWAVVDAATAQAFAAWWYLEGPRVTPQEDALASDVGARVAAAVARLSPAHREVLLLVGGEGLAPEEAARVLGLSAAAARQRLHRARLQLATRLDRADGTPHLTTQLTTNGDDP
jgi:RNA polymerase sigma-70 factor (ECF subfamily)